MSGKVQKKQTSKNKKKVVKKSKKSKLFSPKVIVHIKSTQNNSIVTATDLYGNVVAQSSCGRVGFKGTKKSTPYASTLAGEMLAKKVLEMEGKECDVYIKGVGAGRQAVVKGLKLGGLRIVMLLDKTPVPHGGCKPRKIRKV